MAALIYSAIASLDGYVADVAGKFDWSVPDEEVHAFVNDQERPIGTYVYGRKMYEVMRAWQDDALLGDRPNATLKDYASIWRAADKVVVSTTLTAPTTPRTRIATSFDPEAVRALVSRADADVSIGGPTIAAAALRAGLVSEIRLFLSPAVVGGGLRALPDDLRLDLELLDTRRFANGVVFTRHAVRAP
ncbi:dihydrofolate reductase family protein [Baekduia sp. Peel2402]|uniref:dihydrofolate reductase family protein n=1 Tax=Baekduia sp. Peel2402 TaxID=3458296 RepID=UPI00403EA2B4